MFTCCILALFCLLLGDHLEARPLPLKQKIEARKQLVIRYMGHPYIPIEKMEEGIPISLDTIPVSRRPFRVLLNGKKTRYRGGFLQRPDIYRAGLMTGSSSLPEKMTTTKKQRVIIAHNLPKKFPSKEKMLEFKAPKRGVIREGLSIITKWILTGLGIFAICLCLCLRYLKDMFDRHGDKIPFDKIIKMYSKPEQEE